MCRRWLNWGKKQLQELLQKVNEVISEIKRSYRKNIEVKEVKEVKEF